jgi:acyl-CoA synthetase (AMP-forming)/AMP-acid ligase II
VTIPLVYAVSRLGALYVIVNDQMRSYVLRHIAADCEPRLVVAAAAPSVAAVEAFDGSSVCAAPDPSSVLNITAMLSLEDPPCLSIDPVSLIYTSGSTAMPKAVVSTHREVLFAATAIQSRLRYRADDVVYCCLPLSFDYGLYQVFLACLAGSALVLGNPEDAGPPLLGALCRTGATILPAVPTLANILTLLLARSGTTSLTLRMVTNTGAAMPPALIARLRMLLPEVLVIPMFGLTECKRVSIMPLEYVAQHPGSSGVPLPDTEIFVVDDQGNRLPAGEIGELIVRGPHVMSGYWRAPELTAAKFRQDQFGERVLHTGDMCRIDEDGHLFFVGRRDDLYKQRGIRISAIEVEAAAADIPGVGSAAVLPPDSSRGAVLVVTGDIAAETVMEELALRLETERLPQECRIVQVLPARPNGKIDKQELVRSLDLGASE